MRDVVNAYNKTDEIMKSWLCGTEASIKRLETKTLKSGVEDYWSWPEGTSKDIE